MANIKNYLPLSQEAIKYLESCKLSIEKFRTGGVCIHNHNFENQGFSIRYLINGSCLECGRSNKRKQYQNNSKKLLERHKKYADANRETINAYHKQRYQEKREEILEEKKTYAKNNKAKIQQKRKERYQNNPELYKRQRRERRLANPEKAKAIQKKCYLKNTQLYRIHGRKRRALEALAITENISAQDYRDIKNHFNHECVYCGVDLSDTLPKSSKSTTPLNTPQTPKPKLHWDHVTPIAKDGKHCKANLVPSCDRCNLSKNAKLLEYWYPLQPFYDVAKYMKIVEHTNTAYSYSMDTKV